MSRLQQGFDRLAPFYDGLVRLFAGHAIPESQAGLVPFLEPAGTVLVIGGGTGLFLEELCAAMPTARFVNVELSAGMLQRAKGRTGPAVEHRHGGLEMIRENERFDLICTHCFLDLFEDRKLEQVMVALDRALADGGIWLFGDFQSGQGRGSMVRSLHIRLLYLFFRISCGVRLHTLPDFQAAFSRLGYRCVQSREFLEGMLVTRVYRRNL
ncbi:MAG: methyltransferase domain-containing protein [Acidobacteria bacterium]|uniref:Methyltransferase domain-containing protein n=1 Tax=Candidatus Polarisedimenticola svalbardensis TaxID=2886004 RepID=A0A8J6Y0K5_9BACT|nr:methyltransferase domain-containing protein [Candidatus Polarisedimenticola svalbardensis]